MKKPKDKPVIEHLQDAMYGPNNYSSEAASMIGELNEAIYLEKGFEACNWPGVSNETVHKIIQDSRHWRAWGRLTKAFTKAVESGNGDLFRQMAHLIECRLKPVDTERTAVRTFLQICHDKRLAVTAKDVAQVMRRVNKPNGDQRDVESILRQAKRYLAECNVKSAGKPGRPKKHGENRGQSRAEAVTS